MNTVMKYVRWLGCIPVGLVGGTLIAVAGLMAVMILLDFSAPTAALGCFLCAVLQPIAVYWLGMRVAPDRGELSRNLMLLANWLLLFCAGCDLTRLLIEGPFEGADLFESLSPWWTILADSSGVVAGCFWVFKDEDSEEAAGEPTPVEFAWDGPASRVPAAR